MQKPSHDSHRAREVLIDLSQKYQIWADVEQLRQEKEEMGWPDWCYLPMGGWHAIASSQSSNPIEASFLTSLFAAIGTWRMTQGIYRFDPALYPALIDTPVSGDIPIDTLYQLPEWAIYLETPDLVFEGFAAHGVWCHLEFDYKSKRHELRLLVDTDQRCFPVILHLKKGSLLDLLESTLEHTESKAKIIGAESGAESLSSQARKHVKSSLAQFLPPVLSLLLYICSQQEFTQKGVTKSPSNPASKKTKKGWRTFPANGPLTWDVDYAKLINQNNLVVRWTTYWTTSTPPRSPCSLAYLCLWTTHSS